jgi:hypothetical protein
VGAPKQNIENNPMQSTGVQVVMLWTDPANLDGAGGIA